MICRACKRDHDPMLTCQRAARMTQDKPLVNTSVNTSIAVNTSRSADRHKPGYMAEYMRKRRASLK